MSKRRRGFPSERQVKRGARVVAFAFRPPEQWLSAFKFDRPYR